MTILEERETTQVLSPEREPLVEEERPPMPPRQQPRRVTRWLSWMAAIFLMAGFAAVVAVIVATNDEISDTPSLSDIDPHVSPEILTTQPVVLVAPSLTTIDPHVSPEILTTQPVVLVAPQLSDIDPHVSPEILTTSR